MLYMEAKQYLVDRLKAAGLKSNPHTAQKTLKKSMESHIGAVLFENETYARNGSKTHFRDEQGAKHKWQKIFDRNTTFTVLIGDYTGDAVETTFDRFISSLDAGIYVDGNFTTITVDGADWIEKDDSILKAQVAVQASITFHGGVYRDTNFLPLSGVALEGIENVNGKEPANDS